MKKPLKETDKLYKKKHLKISTFILVVILMFGVGLFIYSYRSLSQAMQDERADAVNQIGGLVTEKVAVLRDTNVSEVKQKALLLENAHVSTKAEASRMMTDPENFLLVTDSGAFRTMDGGSVVVGDTQLMANITSGEGVQSSFATIQTKGDYWLFSIKMSGVNLDGEPIIGLVKRVDAQTYADIAAIPIYDGAGASYVVDKNGVVLMHPSKVTYSDAFQGYNFINILKKENIKQSDIDALSSAMQDGKEAQAVITMNDNRWLIKVMPLETGRSLVLTVPITVTAKTTLSRMQNTIVGIGVVAVTATLLFAVWMTYMVRRSQAVELEQAKARAKSDFMDKMSHDIRTPLNAIVGMNELALESMDDQKVVTDCLEKAKASSTYLISIINDVLDMSRIESGKMTVAQKPFSMEDVLDTVERIETGPAKEKKLELTVTAKTPIDTDFVGDSLRIQQCLMNLLSNAIKFTPEGGRVRLTYWSGPLNDGRKQVVFTVEDTGIGMSEDFLERIFTPFEQAQASQTSGQAGSGLGLSIVRSLTELMGGEVSVESTVGKGSVFTIRLPLKTAPRSGPVAQGPRSVALPEGIVGRRILLVEDHPINRQVIRRLLEKMGMVVDEAENGEVAVEKFAASRPGDYAMIIMDIKMPVMDGLTATRNIRAMDRDDAAAIPIVALSANAYAEDADKSTEAGMQAHLAKPIEIEEMRKALATYIKPV